MKRYWFGLALWGGGLVLIWWLSKGNWQLVGAIATWFLALGVAYAFLQIREAKKSTNAHVAIEISRELRDEDNIALLGEIYSYQPKHLKEELSNERIRKIERVINRLSMLGVFVAKDIIDEELAIKYMAGTTALRCWYQLHSYIKETQQKRGYFGEDYENFVRRSLDYFRNANIQVLFSREGEIAKIDLVTKLQENEFHPRSLKEIERSRKKGKV